MPINEAKIQNFKKHRQLEMRFSPGVNLLVGPNYSGKSSALMALLYTLFGPSSIPGGAKHAKSHGVRNRPKIELDLEIDAKVYRVTRSGASAKMQRKSGQEWELQATGQAAVTKEVESLLGMNAKTFQILRTSPQDEVQAILTLGSEKLGALVKDITQVDVIDRVIAKAKQVMPEEQESYISQEEIDKESSKEAALRHDLSVRWAALVECRDTLQEKTKERDVTKARYRELWDKYQRSQQISQQRAGLERTLGIARERVQTMQEVAQEWPQVDLEPMEKKVEKARTVVEALKKKEVIVGNARAEIPKLEKEIADGEEFLKRYDSAMEAAVGALEQRESLYKELKENQEKKVALGSEIARREEELTSGVCSLCQRPFEEDFSPEETEQELFRLRDSLSPVIALEDSLESRISGLSEALLEAEKSKGLKEDMLPRLESARESLAQSRKFVEMNELELSELTLAQSSLAEATKALDEARKAQETALAASRDLSVARGEVEKVRALLENLDDTDVISLERMSDAERVLRAAEKAQEQANRLWVEQDTAYRNQYLVHQKISQWLVEAKETASKAQASMVRRKGLQKLIRYLRDNRDRFLTDVWGTLLQYASEFASLSTNGDIVAVSRSEDGEFLFDEGDGFQPVITASGVQKAILGVGVRLALAEALNTGADFMLLDEVTAGASDDISLAITRALAASGVQIIAVTHRQDDAAVADTVIQF
jgi:exonuclease SbcC